MGLDPTRKHQRRKTDYLFVAACCVVVVALLVWALLG
jgi:hypothetical protein